MTDGRATRRRQVALAAPWEQPCKVLYDTPKNCIRIYFAQVRHRFARRAYAYALPDPRYGRMFVQAFHYPSAP